MTDKRDVWVFIEQEEGYIAEVSLELLGKGFELAELLGGQVWAVLLGHQVQALAETVIQHGADRVLVADHPELALYRTLPYARVAADLVSQYQPYIFLIGASPLGRDLAPRVASALRCGLTADCTDLQIGDFTVKKENKVYTNLLYQIRPAFGGNIIATIISPDTVTQMATVREGVMELSPVEHPKPAKLTELAYRPDPLDELVQIIDRHREPSKVNLKGASIICSGGYGLGSKENFRIIHELAHVLGGEVAGSRAAVDAGFVPHERQVGQTGTTVRPKLYLAVGISGAIQHRAGMMESNKIVAINTDPDAPIFEVAHYGIVGDAMEVVPRLIRVYKQRLK